MCDTTRTSLSDDGELQFLAIPVGNERNNNNKYPSGSERKIKSFSAFQTTRDLLLYCEVPIVEIFRALLTASLFVDVSAFNVPLFYEI